MPLFRDAILVLALFACACGSNNRDRNGAADAGNSPDAAGSDATAPNDTGAPSAICTTPTAVPCTDEQILALGLFDTVAARRIENVPDTGGGFVTDVDANGGVAPGTIQPTESYVYARFTDTGLVKVDIDDEAAFESMDWDIAFRRFVIRINSGTGGPSCVGVQRTAANTDYEMLAAAPTAGEYRTEEYMTESCDIVPDGSGLGSPGVALSSYWEYPGCVQMTGNVYVVQLASGRRLKLVVTRYYSEAQQRNCDENGALGSGASGAGQLQFRWQFLPQ